jgi:hypothetical protein
MLVVLMYANEKNFQKRKTLQRVRAVVHEQHAFHGSTISGPPVLPRTAAQTLPCGAVVLRQHFRSAVPTSVRHPYGKVSLFQELAARDPHRGGAQLGAADVEIRFQLLHARMDEKFPLVWMELLEPKEDPPCHVRQE